MTAQPHTYDREDQEIIDCSKVGEIGHWYCGVCPEHNRPRFECGCIADATTPATQAPTAFDQAERARIAEARIMTRTTTQDGLTIRETASLAQAPDGRWCVAYRKVDALASWSVMASFVHSRAEYGQARFEFQNVVTDYGCVDWQPVALEPAQGGSDA